MFIKICSNFVDQQVVSEPVDYSYDPDPFEGLHDNNQSKNKCVLQKLLLLKQFLRGRDAFIYE